MPAISSRKPFRIGRSRTGLGLFATKPIKKGTEIIEYFGPLLDSRNEKHDAIENKYLFEINGRWTIDGSVRRNVARYINHACRPNAESDVRERKRKVFIRAIKNIAPGEEINYDYGKDYFNEFLKPIGCKCAACEKKRKLARAEARAAKVRAARRAAARAANGAQRATKSATRPRVPTASKRAVRSGRKTVSKAVVKFGSGQQTRRGRG
ncbi:MAG: SET domain-containing protein [Xanthobacteraceae bacterium]